jgi:hypothetical protein
MRLLATAGLAMLGLAVAPAPALALTCMFRPFQAAGERFGRGDLVAHVEVLDVRANRTMDARVLLVLHGREARTIISIDAAGSLGWNMARQWGFEPFARGSQWVVVLVPTPEGTSAWQLPVCRAYLKVESGVASGPLADVGRMERMRLDALAVKVAAP